MRLLPSSSWPAALILAWALVPCPVRADAGTAEDEQALKKAGVATDGPALVAFLHKQTAVVADQERLTGLVRRLGDGTFRVRNQASAELTRLGPPALPEWRRPLKIVEPEIRG